MMFTLFLHFTTILSICFAVFVLLEERIDEGDGNGDGINTEVFAWITLEVDGCDVDDMLEDVSD